MIFSWQSLILTTTLFLTTLSSPTPPDENHPHNHQHPQQHPQQQLQQLQLQDSSEPSETPQDFQRLLADVEESSIHSVLHLWSSKFQDGVFSRDRTALEAVHSENAPLATSLLHVAKRQASNNTVSSNPISSSVVPDPETSPSESPASALPTPSPSESPASALPTPSPSESPASALSTPSPSTSDGVILPVEIRTTPTRSPTVVAVPLSTPASATPVSTSDGAVIFSITATDGSAGALTTVEATTSSVFFSPFSSTVLSTFTLPNGNVQTQTSITVVDAAVTGGNVGQLGTASGGGPSLQEGVASATKGVWKEVVAVVGGAVIMGLAM